MCIHSRTHTKKRNTQVVAQVVLVSLWLSFVEGRSVAFCGVDEKLRCAACRCCSCCGQAQDVVCVLTPRHTYSLLCESVVCERRAASVTVCVSVLFLLFQLHNDQQNKHTLTINLTACVDARGTRGSHDTSHTHMRSNNNKKDSQL